MSSPLPLTIIKLGTKLVSSSSVLGGINEAVLASIAYQIFAARELSRFIIVSSGAIGLGLRAEGLPSRPTEASKLQYLSTIGQPLLINAWDRAFSEFPRKVGQLLLTTDDFKGDRLASLLGVLSHYPANRIPIVNENDGVTSTEITFGDNDQLAARLAVAAQAQCLILLTNVDGYLDAAGQRVPVLATIPSEALAYAESRGATDSSSKGGMYSKLLAAQAAQKSGITTTIAPGARANVLLDILRDADVGTRIPAL